MLLVRHEAHQKDKLLVDSFISDMGDYFTWEIRLVRAWRDRNPGT